MSRRVFQKSCGVVPVHLSESGEPRFLLLNSGQVRNPKATWEFPKGGLEEGESEEETAVRECREETGLTQVRLVPGYRAMDVYIFHRSATRIKKWVVYFLALVDDPTMKPEPDGREHVLDAEGRWYQWLSFEDTKKTLFHSGQRRVLSTAWAHLMTLGAKRLMESAPVPEAANGRGGASVQPASSASSVASMDVMAVGGLER